MAITFIPNEVAIQDLFHSPDGMVMRFLMERSSRVQDAARANIGGHGATGVDNSTGKLAAGIVKRMLPAESSVMIGCDTLRYALWVEVGNGPEGGRIFPVHSKVLRFTSGGQVFFRTSVRTSKPTRYLTRALPLALTG